MAQYEILKVSCDDSKKNNQMKHKQEMQIINIESNMRKDTYILFFNFISDILNQINSLTNNLGKKAATANNVDLSKYEAGVKVFHKKFGEGIISMVEPEGEDLKVDINFEKVGHKRLMAKFANLEII